MLLVVFILQMRQRPSEEANGAVRQVRSSEVVSTPGPASNATDRKHDTQYDASSTALVETAQIEKAEIITTVDQYLQLQTGDDPTVVMSLYGESVDFYDKGYVTKDFILQDKREYFSRWPKRSYDLASTIITSSSTSGVLVSFEYTYHLNRGDASRRGRAFCELIVQKLPDGVGIVSEKGKVIKRF